MPAYTAAGEAALAESFAVGRRVLEPLKAAAPERWTDVLSAQAAKLKKKDPARAAALLGISRDTLYRKMRDLKIREGAEQPK